MESKVSECQVVEMWQRLSSAGAELCSTDGRPLRIVYPGRASGGQGADFCDAVIETRQGNAKGDIEVHVRSSDWLAHRHHRNPAYNTVVLHVVLQDDAAIAPYLQNGQSVTTIALEECPSPYRGLAAGVSPLPCSRVGERLSDDKIGSFLDDAGDERFTGRAAQFMEDLQKIEAGQCLYQGLMEALGYSQNKLQFQELARRVTFHALESISQSGASKEECLARQQALLMGTAGLLPSQRHISNQRIEPDGGWVDCLEKLWAESAHPSEMSPGDWHLFKVRPVNFPVRRMAAMSYLLFSFRGNGLLEESLGMVGKAVANRSHKSLEDGFTVAAEGYWSDHYDFGRSCRESPTLVGRGRAADIVVNVILPFTLAWSSFSSRPGLSEGIMELYRSYPRLEPNALERHMRRQMGLGSSLVNSARRQQGLLHIYKTLCTQGLCRRCPLSG
ncbi:MAG: DUF2851 family protein [Chloroflexi bacterium]|nr:DUF2851 family protein [Chloroflexota bacterium]